MNLQHLRYVAEVERTGSITRAAKNLYMGQPNLSKAIRELENEVGITIFRRTRKGVEPTEDGLRFLGYARSILSQMDELESLYKPQNVETMRIAVSVPRATYITAAFAALLRRVPDASPMEVHFRETSSMGAMNDVVHGESGVAVVRYQVIHEEYYLSLLKSMKLRYQPIWEFRMCLLMSEEHPLARATEIPFHQLDGYTEVALGDVQESSLSLSEISRDAKLQGAKRKIYVYERGSQYNFLQRVPGTYMWVSPIPFSILAENHLVMKECPLSTMVSKDILVYKEDHSLTEWEKQFLEEIHRQTDEFPLEISKG